MSFKVFRKIITILISGGVCPWIFYETLLKI